MDGRRDYRDAYGQHARICDERRGKYPFRLLVYTPTGCCSHNGVYATETAAKMAMRGLGYCWSEQHPAGAYTRL